MQFTKGTQTRTIYASGRVVITDRGEGQLPRRRTFASPAEAQAEVEEQTRELIAAGWTAS